MVTRLHNMWTVTVILLPQVITPFQPHRRQSKNNRSQSVQQLYHVLFLSIPVTFIIKYPAIKDKPFLRYFQALFPEKCFSIQFKSNIRETWRVILVSEASAKSAISMISYGIFSAENSYPQVKMHILCRITAHPRGAFISIGDLTPTETNLLLLAT